jgi:hypothetical protein
MLWQCHESTQIVFLSVLWPQFDLWSFLPVLWEWQWRVQKEKKKARALDDGESENKMGEKARLRGRSRGAGGSMRPRGAKDRSVH